MCQILTKQLEMTLSCCNRDVCQLLFWQYYLLAYLHLFDGVAHHSKMAIFQELLCNHFSTDHWEERIQVLIVFYIKHSTYNVVIWNDTVIRTFSLSIWMTIIFENPLPWAVGGTVIINNNKQPFICTFVATFNIFMRFAALLPFANNDLRRMYIQVWCNEKGGHIIALSCQQSFNLVPIS